MQLILQSMMAGLATFLGAIIVLLFQRPGDIMLAALLGLSGGLMLGVVIQDLIPSAIAAGSYFTTGVGIMAGGLMLNLINALLDRALPLRRIGRSERRLASMGYMIATAIAMHDLPEGMSIAVGHAAAPEIGIIITLALALHNIPEGMATAAPLHMAGIKPKKVLILTLFISFVTPLGTLIGMSMVAASRVLISPLLSLAAGSMAYIVFSEIVPEAFRRRASFAFAGLLIGFILIYFVNNLQM